MNPYPAYGPGPVYPAYGPIVPPPNDIYAPPRLPQGYNGYAPAPYAPHYRRPSDPGPGLQNQAPVRGEPPRRGKPKRAITDEPSAISRPIKPRKGALTPDFLFVSLSSHDTLRISNIPSSMLMENIKKDLLVSWPTGFGKLDEYYNGQWKVFLGGEVWTATGSKGISARRFISDLFATLAVEGFGYLTTVNYHPLKAPRLVFTSVPPDHLPQYFMIAFSHNRRTLHIIDAPPKLALLLGKTLRVPVEPQRIHGASGFAQPPAAKSVADSWIEDDVYEVVTGTQGTGQVDLAVLMGSVLKLISAEGWRFEASVPFGKSGFLGLRGRREVWMFRRDKPRMVPRPDARRGRA